MLGLPKMFYVSAQSVTRWGTRVSFKVGHRLNEFGGFHPAQSADRYSPPHHHHHRRQTFSGLAVSIITFMVTVYQKPVYHHEARLHSSGHLEINSYPAECKANSLQIHIELQYALQATTPALFTCPCLFPFMKRKVLHPHALALQRCTS